MTLKIEAWQSKGKACDKCIDKFEFCCWKKLYNWINAWKDLNGCDDCNNILKTKKVKTEKENFEIEHIKQLIKIINKYMAREVELLKRLPFKDLTEEEEQKVIMSEIEL